jgi:hypothetical protein
MNKGYNGLIKYPVWMELLFKLLIIAFLTLISVACSSSPGELDNANIFYENKKYDKEFPIYLNKLTGHP